MQSRGRSGKLALALLSLGVLVEIGRFVTALYVSLNPGTSLVVGIIQAVAIAAVVWLGSRQPQLRPQPDDVERLVRRIDETEADLHHCREDAARTASDLQGQIVARDRTLIGFRQLALVTTSPGSSPDHDLLLDALCKATGADAGVLMMGESAELTATPDLASSLSDALQVAATDAPDTAPAWTTTHGHPATRICTFAIGTAEQKYGTAALLFGETPQSGSDEQIVAAAGLVALALLPAETHASSAEPDGAQDDDVLPDPQLVVLHAEGENLYDVLRLGRVSKNEGLRYIRALATLLSAYHHRGQPYMLRPDTAVVDIDRREIYVRQHLITLQVAQEGTEYYEGFSAPELVGSQPSPASDVYSLGVYLFMLCTGHRPLSGRSLNLALDHLRIVDGLPGVEYLLRRALWPQPAYRFPDAQAFLDCLNAVEARQRPVIVNSACALDIGAELHIGLNKGRYRGANVHDLEDRLFWDYTPESGQFLFVIADGVSQASVGSGSEAALIVTEEAARLWQRMQHDRSGDTPAEAELHDLLERANRAVVEHFASQLNNWQSDERPEPMAAAVCAAIGQGNLVTIANVGDVHAFLVTPSLVMRLTQPHTSVADALADPGMAEDAIANLSGSTLTQTVGAWRREKGRVVPLKLRPAVTTIRLSAGDSLVLASDGLYGYAREAGAPFEETLRTVLESTPDAQRAAFRLMMLANNRGGGDNISCIVCRLADENRSL